MAGLSWAPTLSRKLCHVNTGLTLHRLLLNSGTRPSPICPLSCIPTVRQAHAGHNSCPHGAPGTVGSRQEPSTQVATPGPVAVVCAFPPLAKQNSAPPPPLGEQIVLERRQHPTLSLYLLKPAPLAQIKTINCWSGKSPTDKGHQVEGQRGSAMATPEVGGGWLLLMAWVGSASLPTPNRIQPGDPKEGEVSYPKAHVSPNPQCLFLG